MMPLVMNEDNMNTLAHGLVIYLPLWIALALAAVVSLYVVIFGR